MKGAKGWGNHGKVQGGYLPEPAAGSTLSLLTEIAGRPPFSCRCYRSTAPLAALLNLPCQHSCLVGFAICHTCVKALSSASLAVDRAACNVRIFPEHSHALHFIFGMLLLVCLGYLIEKAGESAER